MLIKTKRKVGKVFRVQEYVEPYDPVTDDFLDFDLEEGSIILDLGYDNEVGERLFLCERGLVLLGRYDYSSCVFEIKKENKKKKGK